MNSGQDVPRGDVASGTRIFGMETEYGFAALGPRGQRIDPVESITRLLHEIRRMVAYLPFTGECDVFTANGSRVYVDTGLHPEVATSECSTPQEVVLYSRAGDRLLARAAQATQRALRNHVAEIVLWKGNVDHRSGATWASHESYLHRAPQPLLARHLMTHLVTRKVYAGAGGFDSRSETLRFVLSPRAFHLKRTVSGNSTADRGIFHTRSESLAERPFQRLHVLCGESLWSHTADYLRIGTTALLVAQIDAGRQPQTGLDLASPLEALATIAADVRCTERVRLRNSEALTAIAIQRRLLESVEADLGADHLPAWAPEVCARWRHVLDCLEATPASLVGVLDWPTKLAVLERLCAALGLQWTFSDAAAGDPWRDGCGRIPRDGGHPAAARLLETDARFNRLDDTGIFAALDRENALAHRIVGTRAIANAQRTPPSLGRARIRAAWVKKLADKRSAISCYWDRIVDKERKQVISLGDPFQSEGEQWTPIPSHFASSHTVVLPGCESIAAALSAGAPRQALRHMRTLLERPGRISPAMYRYCVNAVANLVPCWPVPVLRRGGATAGPVLELLLDHAQRMNDRLHGESVGSCLYRYYEARGRYHRARRVVERLLEHAREADDGREIATLENNLGFQLALSGLWAASEERFHRAIALFEVHGTPCELLNARANLLESRFAQIEPEQWHTLVSSLREINRGLLDARDWRARKTLRLLGRFAAHRGRWSAARGWVRRAIGASRSIPTQLREWDRDYLHSLEARATERL